jgi:hypothetical protein
MADTLQRQRKRPAWKRQRLASILEASEKRCAIRTSQQSYIYFIECAGFVKIGTSTRPQKRFVGIRVSNPFDCKLMGVLRGNADGEQKIHKFIESHHHRGEWYRLTDDLRGLIAYLLGPDDMPSPPGWPSEKDSWDSRLWPVPE